MSVYFHVDVKDKKTWMRDTPCLCAQRAPEFTQAMGKVTEELKPVLKKAANPHCPVCRGSGCEEMYEDDAPFMNLANANARMLLLALNLDGELWGELTTAEARRAIMRAKARGSLKPYTRQPAENQRSGGSVIAAGRQWHDPGLSENKVWEYIRRFEDFLEEGISRGATKIYWD